MVLVVCGWDGELIGLLYQVSDARLLYVHFTSPIERPGLCIARGIAILFVIHWVGM
jgi:hypothetical protein